MDAHTRNLKPLVKRSPLWPAVRRAHLRIEPRCRACGSADDLVVHHKKPVHLRPDLELEPTNLITLCEGDSLSCHLWAGHLGHWRSWNENVETDADAFFARVQRRPFK